MSHDSNDSDDPHGAKPMGWDMESGWTTISAHADLSFTLWLTGLPGSGKTTLARLVEQALEARGYHIELIDTFVFSRWLKRELHIQEDLHEDHSHSIGYDAFITYICAILARNGVISITTAVSPYAEARKFAREQLQKFVEVYLYCAPEERSSRLDRRETLSSMPDTLYQPPACPELSIDTASEPPERSALHVIDFLEQHGYIAPRWEDAEDEDEAAIVKARLQALGYLD